MHLAISGNIGSGKTTLTKKLSEHYKWIANYEDVEKAETMVLVLQ